MKNGILQLSISVHTTPANANVTWNKYTFSEVYNMSQGEH